jgi:predicted dehydrogenase
MWGFMDKGGNLNWRPPRVAAVGCGNWGKNIARNLARLGALHSICDPNPAVAAKISGEFHIPAQTLAEVFDDPYCEAVALASPAALHGEQVRLALEAGKHVFVEKPLALSAAVGYDLARLARQKSRVLMVGHLLHYHPHAVKLIDFVREGGLGELQRIYARRLSPGKLRTEEDVMWSFAPHDVSVILAMMGEVPKRVWAEGNAILNPSVLDMATIHMKFSSGTAARIHVSWLNPYKEQRLVVVGSKATAVFDDRAEWEDKLQIYDHDIVYRDGRPWTVKTDPIRFPLERREPLREECVHFLHSVSSGTAPRTDSMEAIGVLSVLDAAARSLTTGRHVAPKVFRALKARARRPNRVARRREPFALALDS